MQKFTTAMVALLGATKALKISAGGWGERFGSIMDAAPINDDYHLVAADGEEGGAFQEWLATHNKSYTDLEELGQRLQNFIANNRRIRESNALAEASGAHNPAKFNHNADSDTSFEERQRRLGVGLMHRELAEAQEPELAQARAEAKAAAKAEAAAKAKAKARATGGTGNATTHDWAWATAPVQSQGACGSCWAFTGVVVLEGTEYAGAKEANPSAVKEELSFQMPVDCVDTCSGCNGGFVDRFNQWMIANGVQDRESYPYSRQSSRHG